MADENPLDLHETLLVEEYKYCRCSIAKNVESIEKNEVYVIGAIGATTVFSVASVQDVVSIAAAIVSLILAVLGAVRYWGLDKSIIIDQDYIQGIEGRFNDLQYTTYFRNHSKHDLRQSRYVVWYALVAMTVIFAVYASIFAPFTQPSDQSFSSSPSSQKKNSN